MLEDESRLIIPGISQEDYRGPRGTLSSAGQLPFPFSPFSGGKSSLPDIIEIRPIFVLYFEKKERLRNI